MARRPRAYIDVDVFVYWLAGDPVHGKRALAWIEAVESSGRGEYATSSITVLEAIVVLSRLAGHRGVDRGVAETVVKAFMELDRLHVEPVRLSDFRDALAASSRYGLDFEDALHLVVALRLGVEKIVSSDRDFDAAPIPRVF